MANRIVTDLDEPAWRVREALAFVLALLLACSLVASISLLVILTLAGALVWSS